MQNDSNLKRPLSRSQSIAILSGFSLLVIMLLAFGLSRQQSDTSATPHKPVALPAVIEQGDKVEAMPVTQATPSTHEQAVQQEYLQTLQDKARAE